MLKEDLRPIFWQFGPVIPIIWVSGYFFWICFINPEAIKSPDSSPIPIAIFTYLTMPRAEFLMKLESKLVFSFEISLRILTASRAVLFFL